MSARETVSPSELVSLCAADGPLFSSTFFPQTFRQQTPPFHRDVWELIEDRTHRYVAIKMFRGSGKTTLLRTFCAKRIAYGVSRTILFVSASQAHSVKSLAWLQGQITRNERFASVYGLKPGRKWTEEWIEVRHEVFDITINVVALGITGQIRGLNIDDYRPDLIIADDVVSEESAATEEQRMKIQDLFFGALANSLAPQSEAPAALMTLLQTPFARGDLVELCCNDPHWASREYGCLDPDGDSVWDDRFPTDELRAQKESHINRGQLLLWMREWEVTITSDELKDFRPEWLQYWHTLAPDARMPTFMWIDPTPPPSERSTAIDFRGKDYEAIAVVGVYGGNFYVLELASNRGHEPEWTIANFFRMLRKWQPIRIGVEGVNYQRTLAWLLEREMKVRKVYAPIEAVDDRRKKRHRIVQSLAGPASMGKVYAHPSQSRFIEQFTFYPQVEHDDDLEAVAGAVGLASQYADNEVLLESDPMLEAEAKRVVENWHLGAP